MTKAPVDFKDGVVYLIHFDKPYKHAQHYIGLASNFTARMERHRAGRGSNLIKTIQDAGIGWEVVRIWEAGEQAPLVEKELKAYHNNRALCPICRDTYNMEKADNLRASRKRSKIAHIWRGSVE